MAFYRVVITGLVVYINALKSNFATICELVNLSCTGQYSTGENMSEVIKNGLIKLKNLNVKLNVLMLFFSFKK